MDIDFPYRIDERGRTGEATRNDHIRDLIEQLLFTVPGERVNRPDFGTALMQLVFAPNSQELATTLQALVAGALQNQLADVIRVEGVTTASTDALLTVTVSYTVLGTQEPTKAEFSRSL